MIKSCTIEHPIPGTGSAPPITVDSSQATSVKEDERNRGEDFTAARPVRTRWQMTGPTRRTGHEPGPPRQRRQQSQPLETAQPAVLASRQRVASTVLFWRQSSEEKPAESPPSWRRPQQLPLMLGPLLLLRRSQSSLRGLWGLRCMPSWELRLVARKQQNSHKSFLRVFRGLASMKRSGPRESSSESRGKSGMCETRHSCIGSANGFTTCESPEGV
jgi:hypothetical protein